MQKKKRFETFLTYLEVPSQLTEGEISSIQKSLENLEVHSHRETAIKIMKSSVFSGTRFRTKTGEKGDHSIGKFEQFVIKVATAIDEQSYEIEGCILASNFREKADNEFSSLKALAEQVDSYAKDFLPIENDLNQIGAINPKKLANIKDTLEKLSEGIEKELSRKKVQARKKRYPAKYPNRLIEKLLTIINEHVYKTTPKLVARVIVKILPPELKLNETTMAKKVSKTLAIPSPQ